MKRQKDLPDLEGDQHDMMRNRLLECKVKLDYVGCSVLSGSWSPFSVS